MHLPRLSVPTTSRSAATLAVLGACSTLAACGGSGASSGTTSTTSAASKTAQGPGANRFAALSSCLKKQGITVPSVTPGQGAKPGVTGTAAPGGARPGLKLPEGVTRARYEAALKKCGGADFAPGKAGAFNSSSDRAALVKYASCLRQNGVDVPSPNTSGKGPVFDTKGIDTSSSTFKAAQSKCQSDLKGAFGASGAGGGTPPAGGPPTGGGAPGGGEASSGKEPETAPLKVSAG